MKGEARKGSKAFGMKLFPFKKPTFGLSIGANKLALAELRRGLREPSLRRCAERALPAGLLKLSSSEPNVTDVSALAKEFSALIEGQGRIARPVPIALTLPDLCARVALHEFDALPRKTSELDGLIRWRVQKDWNMPVTDARVTYQTFRMPSSHASAGAPIRVLTVAMRRDVIEPYEQACESAGLIPVRVGLTSLQLFDLCRTMIEATLKTAEECFYLYVGEGSFSFIAVRAGVPVFIRIKPLRNGGINGSAPHHASVVNDELLATLQFYMEREAGSGKGPSPSRTLFLVNGEGMIPALPDTLNVSVAPMGWETLRVARLPSAIPQFTGLPAFAGVMET